MVKKHLIACSGLLVILLLAKLFIYSNPETPLKSFSKRVILPFQHEDKIEPVKKSKFAALTFSNERLPKGKTIAWKMKKYLWAHSYKKIQTHELHRNAARWFPIIVPILKAHGIPEDFKYMPLVESGLEHGMSPRGAAGYWQFMPGTARNYGLKVNGKVDERMSIRKSTVAACKYLNELYGIFHSWTLAAAAYNIGETNLQRQMTKQGHRNYFKMKLNSETASYVYKLIAMKEIIENPLKHGFVSRKKELLAQKEEVFPNANSISPKVEYEALKTLSVLQN